MSDNIHKSEVRETRLSIHQNHAYQNHTYQIDFSKNHEIIILKSHKAIIYVKCAYKID